jgi:hypothetical protein
MIAAASNRKRIETMSDIQTNETVTTTGTEREEGSVAEGTASANRSRRPTTEATERVVDSALTLGRLWAKHGLTLGRLALETSALSLKTTAELLAAVSEAVAPEAPEVEQKKA